MKTSLTNLRQWISKMAFFEVLVYYRRALQIVFKQWHLIVFIFIYQLLMFPESMLLPLFSKILIDQAILNKDLELLHGLIAIGLFVAFIKLIISIPYSMLSNRLNLKVDLTFQNLLFDCVMTRPYDMGRHQNTGEILYKVINDASEITGNVTRLIPNLILQVFQTLWLLGICFYFHAWATLIVLMAMPLSLLTSNWFGKRNAIYNQRTKEAGQDVYSVLNIIIDAIKPIKANHYERQALFFYLKKLITLIRIKIRHAMFGFYTSQFNTITFGAIIALLTYYFLRGVIQGVYTLGFFTAYCAYMKMLYSNIQGYGGFYHNILSSRPAFERVYQLIDSADSKGMSDISELKDFTLRLESVNILSASSNGRVSSLFDLDITDFQGHRLIENICLDIPQNQIAVIIGKNGCGKTTLLNTIIGLTPPDSGNISIGGVSVNDLKHYTLKSIFGCLFCDNLFPSQWISLSGGRTSAGEKIMENFEWTLKRNPKILVLDEPSINLDEKKKVTMLEMLRTCKGCMTMLITTHYPALFKDLADVFYVIENKEIKRVSCEDLNEHFNI